MVNIVDYLEAQGTELDASKVETPRNIRQMIEHNLERLTRTSKACWRARAWPAPSSRRQRWRPRWNDRSAKSRPAARDCRVTSNLSPTCGMSQWPDGTISSKVRFLHALYRDVLYDRVPPGHRVELHRRIAEREETAYGERAGEIAAELADHYSRANEKKRQ